MSTQTTSNDEKIQRLSKAAELTLASFGKLAGCATIAEAIAEPSIRQMVFDMLTREIMPGLELDAAKSAAEIECLFVQLAQSQDPIETHAANASTYLSDILLEPVRARLRQGEPAIRLSLAIAGWIEFTGGEDDAGEEYEYEDPMVGRLLFLSHHARTNPDALATAFLGLEEVFGDDLPNAIQFREQVVTHLGHLLHQGVLPTIEMVLHGPQAAA